MYPPAAVVRGVLHVIREESPEPDELARCMGQSEAWAAGFLEAVTGDDDWADGNQDTELTRGQLEDYQTGFRHGNWLIEAESQICDVPAT